MSIETRRIIVSFNEDGTPVYKQLRAYSQDEMNVKIVKAFVESGRIKEILPSLHFESQTEKGIILKDYAFEWLKRKRKLKENTRIFYERHLKHYIIPTLGQMDIASISVSDVQMMLDKYDRLSRKTLKEMKSTLSQVFKYAMSDELIRRNPCCSVDIVIPSDRKKERQALPLSDYQDIISHLEALTGKEKRFLALCLFTAMRRGEVLGLRWEDIYSDAIHVKRNVTHPQKNRPSITTPKTKAGVRTIPLIEPLRQALSPFEESGFIVGGEEPITMTMYNTMWKRIQESVDMHGATPHTLRHSYLTYAVGATTDFKTIQGISGHSDVFTLMNRYAHPQEEKKVELAEEMTKILIQNAASPKTL